MSSLFSKIIAGGLAAIIVWLIYFLILRIKMILKNRKEQSQEKKISSQPIRITETNEHDDTMENIKSSQNIDGAKSQFLTRQNIQGVLFVVIGCLSLYYATQCTYYDQVSAMGSYFFGDSNEIEHIANEISSQIHAVGMQARYTMKIIDLFQGIFIIIGCGCVAYGATSLKRK